MIHINSYLYLVSNFDFRKCVLILLSAASLTLAGCETLGVLKSLIEPPKVEIKSVDIGRVGLDGIDLEINLKINNPNSTPLNIDRFEYDLAIGNSSLFSGVYDKKVELKSNDVTDLMIPVKLDYKSAGAAVENYLFKSVRDYKLKGSLSSGLFTVPIEDSGKIEMKK